MTKSNAIGLLKHFQSKGMQKQVDEILIKYPEFREVKEEVKEEKKDGKKSKGKQ